jgi:hypothetical protein
MKANKRLEKAFRTRLEIRESTAHVAGSCVQRCNIGSDGRVANVAILQILYPTHTIPVSLNICSDCGRELAAGLAAALGGRIEWGGVNGIPGHESTQDTQGTQLSRN